MAKAFDIALLGGAALVGFLLVSGMSKTGISLNPMDWGKSLGEWLQGLTGGDAAARNSDGSLIQPNPLGTPTLYTMPNGSTINLYQNTPSSLPNDIKVITSGVLPVEGNTPAGYTGSFIRNPQGIGYTANITSGQNQAIGIIQDALRGTSTYAGTIYNPAYNAMNLPTGRGPTVAPTLAQIQAANSGSIKFNIVK